MADSPLDLMVTGCKIEWEIKQLLSLPPAVCIISKLFPLANSYLSIYVTQKGNKINIGLKKEPSEPQCLTTLFGIKKADGSVLYSIHEVLEFVSSTTPIFIQAGFFDRTTLLNSIDCFLMDGNLRIVCDICLKDTSTQPVMFEKKSEKLMPEKKFPILVQNLEDLLLSERETDVTIEIKGKPFKSHRSILVARSDVFAAMFQQDMVEKHSGVVKITDCDPDSFGDFLLYLYTGKTDQVTSDNVIALYTAADKYALQELKEKCAKFMCLNLSIDSTCDILALASMHDETELLGYATNFFMSNVKEIIQNEKWVDFQYKYPHLVTSLFLKTANLIRK